MDHRIKNHRSATGNQSTLLISLLLFRKFPFLSNLKGRVLSEYLNFLLSDPDLFKKIGLLKSGKWKKQYQVEGQGLVPVFFYPGEADWAYLSILSNGTGFSRCYIFVYLLLFDLGVLKLPDDRTLWKNPLKSQSKYSYTLIALDKREKKLQRVLRL